MRVREVQERGKRCRRGEVGKRRCRERERGRDEPHADYADASFHFWNIQSLSVPEMLIWTTVYCYFSVSRVFFETLLLYYISMRLYWETSFSTMSFSLHEAIAIIFADIRRLSAQSASTLLQGQAQPASQPALQRQCGLHSVDSHHCHYLFIECIARAHTII